ncbi:carbonic anhydrase-like [Procambarus clarkii]|uniref:carbonic anhydrase-like n=1 Tax=Procambarus clarkii TaxID=6728 RepID=UPI003744A314
MAAGVGQPTISGGGLPGAYTFTQFHFHWGKNVNEGSEHTINGAKFPGELHMVHYKTEYGSLAEAVSHADGVAVLGILLEVVTADNPKLASIITGLSKVHDANTNTTLATFALQDLLPSNTLPFFRYQGSLTTPPCNQVVTWTVFKNTLPISAAQLEEFRKLEELDGQLLEENFRPVQPLNGRQVLISKI